MPKVLKYGAGLIVVYLVVYNGSKSGSVISSAASGSVSLVKAFQGR